MKGDRETEATMKKPKLAGLLALLFLLLGAVGYSTVRWYSYIFAQTITGEIIGVERVTQPSAVISAGGAIPAAQIFSFAVAVKTSGGEIFTASTEDRQWAVAQKGQCAEVKFFPYAPWDLDKAGTFHGARLLKLMECGGKSASP